MHITLRVLIIGCFIVVSVVNSGTAKAQIPEKLAAELTEGKAELEKKFQDAQETLLTAFDKRIAQARTAPKLSATERQDAIGALEAEKAVFQKLSWIPFSPAMRSDAIAYLNTIQKAEIALGKVYDKAINEQTKLKADAVARELIADKKIALAPRVIGKWNVSEVGGNYQAIWSFSSDGSSGTGSWTLDQNHLVKRQPNPKAPGGVWIDTCVISSNGRELKAKNNIGTRFTGKLSVESY